MIDALEDLFSFTAQCDGYMWKGKVHDVRVVEPHVYETPVKPEDRKETYVCEPCARLYARDNKRF